MILELADIRIKPGQQAEFEEAIARGLQTVISQANGFQGAKVNKGIESPDRFILQIFWDTLEDHTIGLESQLYSQSGAPSLDRSLLRRQWLNILCSPTKVNRHLTFCPHLKSPEKASRSNSGGL